MAAIQDTVSQMLRQIVDDNLESGIQVCAYHKGKQIVDAWAGPAGKKIDGNSLFATYSTGKGIAATAVHRLVERKVLAYDDPIAKHWPEFAAHGKGGITLRHALNHTAGMPHMPDVGRMEALRDWDLMCRGIAALEPLHPPGERLHYHAITYTWLLGETVRRADGRDFARVIQEDVCKPLGITELYFGIPDSVESRVIDVEATPPPKVPPPPPPPPATPPPPPDPVGAKAIPPWVCPLEDLLNNPEVRRACVPASNGIMNARSIARHYASLIGDGVDGVRLVSAAAIDHATVWNGLPGGRFGLGYGLSGPDDNPGAVFGHGGYGGSNGFADKRHCLAIGVAKNRTCGGAAVDPVIKEIYRAIG